MQLRSLAQIAMSTDRNVPLRETADAARRASAPATGLAQRRFLSLRSVKLSKLNACSEMERGWRVQNEEVRAFWY
jgi:hypothetical protein